MTAGAGRPEVPSSTRAADTVLAGLVAGGVREVVLCPGSRSAPLAYAARRAERAGALRLHVRIDERTAGFLALGLAKAGCAPVAVITTSGTAVGNLMPSVMEAFHARVPLVVISADRPGSMINSGANQTTDQHGLFGRHVRADARIADTTGSSASWRFAVDRLVALADGRFGGVPGPTQLDVELSDPLLPPAGHPETGDASWPGPPGPTSRATSAPPEPRRLADGPATVIVAGDLPVAAGRRWADRAAAAGLPLLAEPSSNARHGATAIAGYRLLLTTALAEAIERVIMIGRPTLSRPVQRLLADRSVEMILVEPGPEWIDPGFSGALPAGDVVLDPAGDPSWLARWQDADRHLARALSSPPPAGPEPAGTGGSDVVVDPLRLARAVAEHTTGTLVLGSSNPIRDLDLIDIGRTPRAVFANRGLAGIDGTISTAVGVALARPDEPTTALLGDLTFLHDGSGLLIPPGEPRPIALRFVVANDDGGSIFATLEYGGTSGQGTEHGDDLRRLFTTPTGADLGALCAGWGVAHRRITDVDHLVAALRTPPVGVEVIEVMIGSEGRIGQDERRHALAVSALAAATP